ncbi:MAG: hypothetical protein HY925_07660 [Elusimicrobia bacterium]|nr:hypothetical protein [Elusimicrobiota bacterium]
MKQAPPKLLLAASALLLLSCGKGNEPGFDSKRRSKGIEALQQDPRFKSLPVEEQRRSIAALRQFEEEMPSSEAQDRSDRAELVRTAPPGWRPEKNGRHLKLILNSKTARYRIGERLWYSIELKNIGTEPIQFTEGESFFKNGSEDMFRWKVLIDGREVGRQGLFSFEAPVTEPFNPPGFDRLSNRQKSEYARKFEREHNFRSQRERGLNVALAPGETLHSRPGRFPEAGEKGLTEISSVEGPFRELGPYRFEARGKHTVQIQFRNPGPPQLTEGYYAFMSKRGYSRADVKRMTDEAERHRLPSADSNKIEVEVGD